MSRECIVCKRKNGELITLFSFPTNEETRYHWATFCKINYENIRSNDRLCSYHFEPSAFKISVAKTGRRLKLKPDVVPTVYSTMGKPIATTGPWKRVKSSRTESIKTKGKRVYLYCCLCGALNIKVPRFSFPIHEPEILKKWLNVCLFERDDLNVNLHRVCIKHFAKDDFMERTSEKQRLLLKPGAVPSLIPAPLENTILANQKLEDPHFLDMSRFEDTTSENENIEKPHISGDYRSENEEMEYKEEEYLDDYEP